MTITSDEIQAEASRLLGAECTVVRGADFNDLTHITIRSSGHGVEIYPSKADLQMPMVAFSPIFLAPPIAVLKARIALLA